MFGAPESAPSTELMVLLVPVAAGVLLAGAVTAARWPERAAWMVRTALAALVALVPLVWHLLTPAGSGVELAARLVLLGPLVLLDLALVALWSRRARSAAC